MLYNSVNIIKDVCVRERERERERERDRDRDRVGGEAWRSTQNPQQFLADVNTPVKI